MQSRIHRMVSAPGNHGSLQALRDMGYHSWCWGVPNDVFKQENGTSDYTRAGNACLNHSICGKMIGKLLKLDGNQLHTLGKALLHMKPFKQLEQALVAAHGDEGFVLHRAQVPILLMQSGRLDLQTALLATMTGHTAAPAIQSLLNEKNPELNLLPLITYWISQRVDGKGGLTTGELRLVALLKTWKDRINHTLLTDAMEVSDRCGKILVTAAGFRTEQELIDAINAAIDRAYPES